MIHTIETLKELHEQRFFAMDKAILLVAEEMSRRLEVLSHAHEQAREKERDFIGREAYETFTQRSIDDFAGLRREIQASLTEVSAAREAAFKALANASAELAKIYDSRFGRIESAQAKMFGGLLFAATILPLITGIMVYMRSGKSL
ncbi:MAG: hypothetical protein WCC90_23420 [Methylocella sp.]